MKSLSQLTYKVNFPYLASKCNIILLLRTLSCLLIVTFPVLSNANGESNISESGVVWNEIEPGLAVATIKFKTQNDSLHHNMTVLRLSAGEWQFQVGSKVDSNNNVVQRTARKWLEDCSAEIVINSGQYDENNRYLGWLIEDGKNLGSKQHPIWKGLLVGGSQINNHAPISIVDLATNQMSIDALEFRHAVQSLMLFDETKRIRVNQTQNSARRSVLATDSTGNLYLIVTRGEITLWSFAKYLLTHSIGFKQAISLDGGSQAQLSVKTNALSFDIPGYQTPIPYVIEFYRTKK